MDFQNYMETVFRPSYVAARLRSLHNEFGHNGSAVMPSNYFSAMGGHPDQNKLMTGRAVFTDAYAFIPRGCMRDIVTSYLPFWEKTRLWVIARPLSGFAETFSQYIVEVEAGGGSDKPEQDKSAQAALFVVGGTMRLTYEGQNFELAEGGYTYIPPGTHWSVKNEGAEPLKFHWIRKSYQAVDGLDMPDFFITSDQDITPTSMPDTDGAWATTMFVDPTDLRHDMHVNIVTLKPGAVIPFEETHVMEHGLYALEGKAVYKLNQDWVEVEAGDFMWLRAFCPQACYAGGTETFRYLLYKDVNRHMPLKPF